MRATRGYRFQHRMTRCLGPRPKELVVAIVAYIGEVDSNQIVLAYTCTQPSANGPKCRISFSQDGLAVSRTSFRSSEPKANACSSVQNSVVESRAPKTFASAQCAKLRKRFALSPERSVSGSLTSRPRHVNKRVCRSLTRLVRVVSKVRAQMLVSVV